MRFSLGIPSRGLNDVGRDAAAAEAAGFELLRVGDMQSTTRDVYSSLTLIADRTNSARIAPGVTNPVTRHPAVTAAAIASVDELSGGRAVLGIGAGDSAVRNLGLRPATRKQLTEYITSVRELHQFGRSRHDGHEITLHWWDGKPIPVFIAAQGPAMLQLAGGLADGIIVGSGTSPIAVEYALEQIEAGASAVGRSLDEIEIWFLTYVNFDKTASMAADTVASALAVAGNFVAGSRFADLIPDHLQPKFEILKKQYAYSEHFKVGSETANARLVRELGLLDFLASAFGLVGTESDIVSRLDELKKLGVSNVWMSYAGADFEGFIEQWSGLAARTPSA